MKKTAAITIIVFTAIILIIVSGSTGYSSGEKINNGAEDINLPSGSKKSADFPHKKHQDTLKDCNICHTLFPMEKGIIQKKIAKGSMKEKTVMNACRGCHRKMKKQGMKTGPTSCSKCHAGK